MQLFYSILPWIRRKFYTYLPPLSRLLCILGTRPPRINSQSRSNDSKKGIYTLMPYVTECVLPFVRLIDDFPRRPAAAAYQRDGTFPRWVLLCPAGNHLSDGICRRLDENQSLYSRGIDVRLVTKRCCLIILPCVQVIFVNNPWHYPALL